MSKELREKYSWHLWKRQVTDGGFQFLHSSDLPQLGFASVYAVDDASAEALHNSPTTTGFKGVVWSPYLWVDCDTEEASNAVYAKLKELGLGFVKWTTGNRGSHYQIERAAKPSQLLPLLDKAFVKLHFPLADMRLYSHLHLFRQPGNPHEKSGLKKEIVESVSGTVLSYDDNAQVAKAVELDEPTGNQEFGSVLDDERIMKWSVPQEEGLRHEFMRNLALRFAERKESTAFALRWMEHVNLLYSEPKPQRELQRLVEWAYQVKSGE